MASVKKSKTATRKTKAIRQATFRNNLLTAGRARWEVLVSGSEKDQLKKLLADIRKATTGSIPAPATGSTLLPAKPATTGSIPAPAQPATTGSVPAPAQPATTGSVPAPASGSREWHDEFRARLATTGSTPAPTTGSAQPTTTGSL